MSHSENPPIDRFLRRAPNEVRRKDRAVEDEAWICRFLDDAAVGTLATEESGQPFINSNLFVFDRERRAIYLHTAHIGRTRANAEQNLRVCFHAFAMGRLLPADAALEFSVEYEGVTAFGEIHVVEDSDEGSRALQQLLDKYAPHLKPRQDYRPVTQEELARTAVYRIDIEQWSGKRKQVAADFPGAFEFGAIPRKI